MSCITPVPDICPPLVCCPLSDYDYDVAALNIWQTSDYGLNSAYLPANYSPEEVAVAKLMLGSNPDLLLLTGNHAFPPATYETAVEIFFGGLKRSGLVLPVPGNQDWEQITNYLAYFYGTNPAKPFFKRSFGNADFFMLSDGYDNNNVIQDPDMLPEPSAGTLWVDGPCGTEEWKVQGGATEWRWLVEEARKSTARWKIVCVNHPPFSSGTKHGSYPNLQWQFADLGIDLVISGYEPVYERLVVDGVTYVVNGLGGVPIGGFIDPPIPGSRARYNASHGALQLRIFRNKLVGAFMDLQGFVKDQFIFIKRDQ